MGVVGQGQVNKDSQYPFTANVLPSVSSEGTLDQIICCSLIGPDSSVSDSARGLKLDVSGLNVNI